MIFVGVSWSWSLASHKSLPAYCMMSVLFLGMTETVGQGQSGHDSHKSRRLRADELSRHVTIAAYIL